MTEYDKAAIEARQRGMAFLVDGQHVNADRIMILSLPDTTGPISNMRKAKAEAKEVLEQSRTAMLGLMGMNPSEDD